MAEVKILDRYSFDPTSDKLGEGGSSTAYKAQDLHRKRTVLVINLQKRRIFFDFIKKRKI
jgi:hypothetical protein